MDGNMEEMFHRQQQIAVVAREHVAENKMKTESKVIGVNKEQHRSVRYFADTSCFRGILVGRQAEMPPVHIRVRGAAQIGLHGPTKSVDAKTTKVPVMHYRKKNFEWATNVLPHEQARSTTTDEKGECQNVVIMKAEGQNGMAEVQHDMKDGRDVVAKGQQDVEGDQREKEKSEQHHRVQCVVKVPKGLPLGHLTKKYHQQRRQTTAARGGYRALSETVCTEVSAVADDMEVSTAPSETVSETVYAAGVRARLQCTQNVWTRAEGHHHVQEEAASRTNGSGGSITAPEAKMLDGAAVAVAGDSSKNKPLRVTVVPKGMSAVAEYADRNIVFKDDVRKGVALKEGDVRVQRVRVPSEAVHDKGVLAIVGHAWNELPEKTATVSSKEIKGRLERSTRTRIRDVQHRDQHAQTNSMAGAGVRGATDGLERQRHKVNFDVENTLKDGGIDSLTRSFVHEDIFDMGYRQEGAVLIVGDNKASIDEMERGLYSSSRKPRHHAIRQYWAKELVHLNVLKFIWCPGVSNFSDIGTKVLSNACKFQPLADQAQGLATLDPVMKKAIEEGHEGDRE